MADLFTLAAKMKVACLLRFTENAGPLHLFDTFSLNALNGGFNFCQKKVKNEEQGYSRVSNNRAAAIKLKGTLNFIWLAKKDNLMLLTSSRLLVSI